MVTIERFRAASGEARFWALCEVAVGVLLLGSSTWLWNVLWTPIGVAIGSAIIVFSVANELYQLRWGTWGLIVTSVVLAGVFLAFTGFQYGRWSVSYFIGPALLLAGTASIWWNRPKDYQRFIVPGQVDKYIRVLQRDLRQIQPPTPFHPAADRDFLAQVSGAADWLAQLYEEGAEEGPVSAVYVEMNRFDINTDQWFLDGFTFQMSAGEMFENLEENLGEYEGVCEEPFVLTGTEDLQAVYEKQDIGELFCSETPEDKRLCEAVGITFDLITARAQQLVARAHAEAQRRGHPVGSVRVFANAHDTNWLVMCSPA